MHCRLSVCNSLDVAKAILVVPAIRWKVVWFPHAHISLRCLNQRIGQHWNSCNCHDILLQKLMHTWE